MLPIFFYDWISGGKDSPSEISHNSLFFCLFFLSFCLVFCLFVFLLVYLSLTVRLSFCLSVSMPLIPWGIANNFLRGALNFCFLLRSCTAWRTDSIWEDYRSAQMYNTVCWPKQSVSVPFAFCIKKNWWNYPTCGIILQL